MAYAQQLALATQLQRVQGQITLAVANAVAQVFPTLDVNNIDQSFGAYEAQLAAVTQTAQQAASTAAAGYFMAAREDAGIADDFVPIIAKPVDPVALRTSLLVTGPILMKKGLGSGRTAAEVRALALSATTGALQRHVLNGSRDTVKQLVYRDARCNGWARVSAGRPCWFCAMLVSRGAVYKSEQVAERGVDGDPYHDHCHCYAVAIFNTGRYPGDEYAGEMQDLWYASTSDAYGVNKRRKFRQAFELVNSPAG